MKVSSRPSGSGTKKPTQPQPPNHHKLDIIGLSMIALAVIVLLSLFSQNAGVLGGVLKASTEWLFGRGAAVVSVLLTIAGVCFIRGRGVALTHLSWGLSLIFLAILGFLSHPLLGNYFDPEALATGGGAFGAIVAFSLASLLGSGSTVVLVFMTLTGVVLCVDVPIRDMLAGAKTVTQSVTQRHPRAAKVPAPEKEIVPNLKKDRALVVGLEKDPVAQEPTPAPEPPKKKITFQEPAKTQSLDTESPTPKEGYQLPANSLLAEALLQPKRSASEMQKNIETLEGTLEQFGIEADVVEIAAGPTVTRYEIQLGPGIRVNRITNLADNIAMELAASQVRVEAPIPGKAAIGVEVPNANPSMVTLRELADDPQFRNHPSRLCVALGKDVSGTNKYADLTRMPHLLIGGATNSGKSIGLATLITSLLMRNTPKDVRMVMIDPKRVELTLFDHIPHLMCPVIKDVKEAAGVLRAVWREMDRRYDMFSEAGVRNIDGWNAKASFVDRLPYIVVVVDELADLMIQEKANVETVIVRLAQLARAVGIHMVIATQRPSVDVITGLIKANIPSRIAFSVASYIDSRTILDMKGAEALIGRGDMLFKPIEAIKPHRIQGCYVSEKEIEAVCHHWRDQAKPDYVLNPIDDAVDNETKEKGDFGDETDPLWEDAVTWAVERGQASTSMLQRKFSIGFQRASRLLDMMEARGVVSAQNGPRPREVLINLMDMEAMFGRAPKYDVGRTIGDGLDE